MAYSGLESQIFTCGQGYSHQNVVIRLEDVFLREKKPRQSTETNFWIHNCLKKKNQQRTVTRRHEFDCIEKRIWWLSIMRLHDGAISRHSGSPRKFDDLLAKKGINIGLLGWKKGTVDNGKG